MRRTHDGITPCSHEKTEMLPFAATWVVLRVAVLGEARQTKTALHEGTHRRLQKQAAHTRGRRAGGCQGRRRAKRLKGAKFQLQNKQVRGV